MAQIVIFFCIYLIRCIHRTMYYQFLSVRFVLRLQLNRKAISHELVLIKLTFIRYEIPKDVTDFIYKTIFFLFTTNVLFISCIFDII